MKTVLPLYNFLLKEKKGSFLKNANESPNESQTNRKRTTFLALEHVHLHAKFYWTEMNLSDRKHKSKRTGSFLGTHWFVWGLRPIFFMQNKGLCLCQLLTVSKSVWICPFCVFFNLLSHYLLHWFIWLKTNLYQTSSEPLKFQKRFVFWIDSFLGDPALHTHKLLHLLNFCLMLVSSFPDLTKWTAKHKHSLTSTKQTSLTPWSSQGFSSSSPSTWHGMNTCCPLKLSNWWISCSTVMTLLLTC